MQVQHQLRKRQYDFGKSKEIHQIVQLEINKNKNSVQERTSNVENIGERENNTEKNIVNDSLKLDEQSDKEKFDGSVNISDTVTESSERDKNDVKISIETSMVEEIPSKGNDHMLGPAAEEDLIRVNSREKKKVGNSPLPHLFFYCSVVSCIIPHL